MMSSKCFILCRQSVGESNPEESLSINVQEETCKTLAESNHLEVVDTFKEGNCSGRLYPVGYEAIAKQDLVYVEWCKETRKTKQWRKGLGEILKRINEVEYIVCYDLTRFFRPLNNSLLGNLLSQILQTHNVKLLTLKEGVVDFKKFQDQLISSLTSQINSEQLRTQVEKSKAALKKLRDNGELHIGIYNMYGFKWTGRRQEVELVPSEVAIVKDVYKMYLDGKAIFAIAREINEKYREVLGTTIFTRINAKHIIQNPIYCGYMYDSKKDLVKAKIVEGKEIVSFDTWHEASTKLEANRKKNKRTKFQWLPLSGIIQCGNCHHRMTAKPVRMGRLYSYYACIWKEMGGRYCPITIQSSVHNKYGDGILEAVKPLLLACAVERMKRSGSKEKAKRELEKLDVTIENYKKKEASLTKMYAEGVMDDDAFENAMKAVTKLKQETLREKMKVEQTVETDDKAEKWLELILRMHLNDGNKLGMSKGEYESLANEMFKEILIFKDRVEVKTIYGDVTLPRRQTFKNNLVWHHWMSIELTEHPSYDIIYYNGQLKSIHDRWKKFARLIGKLGEVRVWQLW